MEIEFSEKDGIGTIKLDDKQITNISKYNISRDANTDMIDVTITISVSSNKFKTVNWL